MTDDELTKRLLSAAPKINFPPEFQREIWGRIESAELIAPRSVLSTFFGLLARPIPALLFLVLMGCIGMVVAFATQKELVAEVEQEGYFRSVSPFAAAEIALRK